MKDDLVQWDDVFGSVDEPVSSIAAALRKLVHSIHPETVECVYQGYNGVNFGFGNKMKSDAYLYVMAQKGRVNLGFFRGTSLPDPAGILEGTGKALRHIKVTNMAMVANPALTALVIAAIGERRQALTGLKASSAPLP